MNDQSEGINNAANYTRLRTFIDESKVRLKTILKRLEWNVEKDFVPTPDVVNATKPDLQQLYDTEPEFPSSYPLGNSIITDVEELRKIVKDADAEVPKKFSDLQLNFTRQQKLAIYEHVVMNTEKYTEPEITVPDLGEGALTFAEIVAQKKRETKKRRRYRRSKPTRIEEIRAVVDLHMQALQQYLNAKEVKEQRLEPRVYEKHRHRSDEEQVRSSVRQARDLVKHHKHRRSRSTSLDDKRSKKSKHRSRSNTRSNINKRYKEHIRDSSSNKKKKKHKDRSRSRTRGTKKKSHKRRCRSQSRTRSCSRSRKHKSRRKSAYHGSHEVRI